MPLLFLHPFSLGDAKWDVEEDAKETTAGTVPVILIEEVAPQIADMKEEEGGQKARAIQTVVSYP